MINFENKTFFITGVANKKSIAFDVAKNILNNNGKIILSVQNEIIKEKVIKLFPNSPIICLDVSNEKEVLNLGNDLKDKNLKIDGLLHSLAFARFEENQKFHQVTRAQYLEATTISAFSLIELTNQLLPFFNSNASIIALSISDTNATSYGFLGPIKALLEYNVKYLAKSISYEQKNIRVNAIGSGPLKTSASAGIPNYIDNYLFAEMLTLRKEALKTNEVSNLALFLLSSLSSGINATTITIDAGMNVNHFDEKIVEIVGKNI
jgi:enoyl-[acyl-carrier protein] reductase I